MGRPRKEERLEGGVKMKFKKLCALTLSAVLAATTLAGCSGNGSSADGSGDDSVTLVVMGNSSDMSRPYMEKVFELYQEKTGNKLDLQGLPGDNFEQVSLTKFNTGDIPDIFMCFGNETLKAYNPDKNFVDFSDAEWVSDIEDSVVDQAEYEGKIWGLPLWEASVTGFVYNKEIFKENGLEVPTTQDEFMAVCEKLKNAGINPLYIAFKDVWPMLQQNPMDAIFEDKDTLEKINTNQITYADIPQMKDIVQWYVDMAQNGYLGENYAANSWDYGVDALGTGEYAMMLTWDTWLYTDFDKKYPGEADNFGLMPAFMGGCEQGNIEGPNTSLLLVNKNSEKVDAAIEFINFMADPENYNQIFEGIMTAPVFKGETSNLATPQYEECLENGVFDRALRASSTWGNVIGFTQNEAAKCIQEAMLGSVSVEEAIANMDRDRIAIAQAQQAEGF